MKDVTVAVVGVGPVGLAAVKVMREEGFAVTGFEYREDVGGLWCFSPDKNLTSCMQDTLLNSCKYVSHYTDFPFPDDYPTYPSASQVHQYMRSYADQFGLRKYIEFNTKVVDIVRGNETTKWVVTVESNGKRTTRAFDKVIISHGMEHSPNVALFEGSERFKGTIMHSQGYKSSTEFDKKNVIVVGIGNSAADIAVDLVGKASRVYLAHRRGAVVISRFRGGRPPELDVNYHALRMIESLGDALPSVQAKITDVFLLHMMDKVWEVDPTWGLKPPPSSATTLPCSNESLIPHLAAGLITSVKGMRRFTGARSVELDDGTVLEDIDAVVLGTGYLNDLTITPWVRTSSPANYNGPPLADLFLQIFPPEHAGSIAFLNTFSVLDCPWVMGELSSMAIAQLWTGRSTFPSRSRMEASIRKQQWRNATLWRKDHSAQGREVRPPEFYRFMHRAAGTGVTDALSWGWSGWMFWRRDPEMCRMMGWGIITPHMMRLIETGKRKTWEGAREAIKKANAEANKLEHKPNKFTLDGVRSRQGR